MTQAFEDYNQLRVLKRPLTGVYLSFFLMVTLMILVGATWMGLYLAKRITRPVQMLARGGARDRRRPPRSARRAAERRRVRLADRGVQRDGRRAGDEPPQGRAIDHRARAQARRSRRRRRYIETILERITTGVVSVDAAGVGHHDQQRGGAAARPDRGRGRPAGARACSTRPDLRAARRSLAGSGGRDEAASRSAQEIAIARDGHEVAPRRRRDAAGRRRRRAGRAGAGARRRDAADPRAEGRRVARGRAPAGARDQEPADADPAVGRAAAAPFRRRAAGRAGAGRRVHGRRSSARSNR